MIKQLVDGKRVKVKPNEKIAFNSFFSPSVKYVLLLKSYYAYYYETTLLELVNLSVK